MTNFTRQSKYIFYSISCKLSRFEVKFLNHNIAFNKCTMRGIYCQQFTIDIIIPSLLEINYQFKLLS